MTLRTYCSLRGDKVLNVVYQVYFLESITLDLFTAVQSIFLLYQSVRRISHKLTSSASKKDRWDFMQYVAFEFRGV